MKSSFNAYGRTQNEYGVTHIPVWLGVVNRVPIGGTLAKEYTLKGLLIPAGAPINLTDKVITPFLAMTATTAAANGKFTLDAGPYGVAPSVGDFLQTVNKTTGALGTKKAITAVSVNETDPTKYDVTADIATAADDVLVLSPAETSGAAKPNAYLYHDIWLGNLGPAADDTFATGAAVQFHPDGLLIDRTPAYTFPDAMKALVPGVLHVHA